jgi:two-component system nitrogen regulation response regulator NtrX
MDRARILVVDDEPGVRAALEGILRDEGFAVTTVGSGEEALRAVEGSPFDAVLLDVWLPGKDGLETLMELRDRGCDLEVVMISGHGTIETAVRATKLGAFDFVEKPLSLDKTLLVLRNALRQRLLERRNRQLLRQLDRDTEILGHSAAMDRLRAEIASAAAADAAVLIRGERGTGRETVARRIHAASARADRPFVELPCGALDETAAAEALFGGPGHRGRIELAEGGSLFLEELDLMSAGLQRRLAGSAQALERDPRGARLIASTAADPSTLDPSLRGRLDVIRISIPALREHREDVELLAERFMRGLSREYGVPEKRFDPASLAALRAYRWPGNVRELRNLAERVLLLVPGPVIGVADLPEELGGAAGPAEDLYGEFSSLAEGLETFERYYIRRVVREAGGETLAAARRLGLAPEVLERKLREWNLA